MVTMDSTEYMNWVKTYTALSSAGDKKAMDDFVKKDANKSAEALFHLMEAARRSTEMVDNIVDAIELDKVDEQVALKLLLMSLPNVDWTPEDVLRDKPKKSAKKSKIVVRNDE